MSPLLLTYLPLAPDPTLDPQPLHAHGISYIYFFFPGNKNTLQEDVSDRSVSGAASLAQGTAAQGDAAVQETPMGQLPTRPQQTPSPLASKWGLRQSRSGTDTASLPGAAVRGRGLGAGFTRWPPHK